MNTKSFTLIEILVAIVIVGILSTFIIISLNNVVDSANDAKRKKDLDSISKMLMTYRILNGSYPAGDDDIEIALSDLIPDYTTSFPKDPSGSSYNYSSDGTTYTLTANLSNGEELTYNPEAGFVQGEGGGSGPWLSGYSYRKEITINSSASLTDYQVKIIVTRESSMKEDLRDLRFTLSDSVTELKYWIESTDTDTVWVKIPSLSIGDNTIYMYYGNNDPLLVSTSDGNETFLFFDDFLGSSLDTNKWLVQSGSVLINGGVCVLSNAGIRSINNMPNPSVTRFRFKTLHYASASYDEHFATVTEPWTTNYLGMYVCNRYSVANKFVQSTTSNSSQITIIGWQANTYGIVDLYDNGINAKWYINNSLVATHSGWYPVGIRYYAFGSAPAGASIEIDWIITRKYTATEPTISSWGSEESF